jgi:putative PIN family toxin of toxin-antitoxin system
MIRVVLDTNVIVSAVLVPAGNQASILLLALRGQIAIYVSEPLLAEYEEVLRRPRLKLTPHRIEAALNTIRKVAHSVSPRSTLSISPDESDNRILECAAAARADYLVTGNLKHFPLRLRNTVIVSGRQFLDIITDPGKQ